MRHDVRALQILDPAERTLDFGRAAHWEDLETGQRIYIDPDAARKGYLDEFGRHQQSVRDVMNGLGIVHDVAPTDKPLDFVLLEMIRSGAHAGALTRVNGRDRG